MAKIDAYSCDECGAIVTLEGITFKTERFDGPVLSGERTLDLCPVCTPEAAYVTLKPLRGKRKAALPVDDLASAQPA